MRPYARQTRRLAQAVARLGLAVGGAMGQRLSKFLGFPTSVEVILAHLRKLAAPHQDSIQVLGIDDWAMRKGVRYGTLLVDLKTHQPVDLLPSREVQSVASWLKLQPETVVVSRDRAGSYAEAIRRALPQAVQVADRWHLLKNLKEVLVFIYERHRALLRQVEVVAEVLGAHAAPPPESLKNLKDLDDRPCALSPSPPKRHHVLGSAAQGRAERWQYWKSKFEEVHQLRGAGMTIDAIARQAKLARGTVQKYLRLDAYPKRTAPRFGPHLIDSFKPYLQQRLLEGETSHRKLWQELTHQGFTGSRGTVYRYVVSYRHQIGVPAEQLPPSVPNTIVELNPRRLAALVLFRPEALTAVQHEVIVRACALHPELLEATQLAQAFAIMLRTRDASQFAPWIQRVLSSPFEPLKRFVAGIQRDYAAVEAALSLPWSNGIVEGHVNRLKLIKRQMFGRAKFDLLRLRVLLKDVSV